MFARITEYIDFHCFLQWVAFDQWQQVREIARKHGVIIIGDCPIYVAPDSADVWANREVFKLDSDGNQTCFAGVPPDYFSPKYGQFWGNPIYKWFYDEYQQEPNPHAFNWWARRLRHQLKLVDELRIDHFRGFVAYWEIPRDRSEVEVEGQIIKSARHGQWLPGPAGMLFAYIANELGRKLEDIPIIAEDLGVITRDVNELRQQLEAPGMGIFQFAPWNELYYQTPHGHLSRLLVIEQLDADGIDLDRETGWQRLLYCIDQQRGDMASFTCHEFLPHNAGRYGKLVFYPGTHDNETLCGWFDSSERPVIVKALFVRYLNFCLSRAFAADPQYQSYLAEPLSWKVIRALCAAPEVRYAIFQMQDILGLPNRDDHRGIIIRTNIPNREQQWQWKLGGEHSFTPEIREHLAQIAITTGRAVTTDGCNPVISDI